MGKIQKFPLGHGASLYDRELSANMYDVPDALWEAIKNGWDAIVRKTRRLGQYDGFVDLTFVDDHPLAPGCTSAIIMDNGEGITPASFEKFLKVGSDEVDPESTGATDMKRIGRFAILALIKEKYRRNVGFYVLTSTSSRGTVDKLHVANLSKGYMEGQTIERDDTVMNGICPDHSFTMIVVPHCKAELMDVDALHEDIRWRLPRCKVAEEFTLRINGVVVDAAPLETELVIDTDPDIKGYFQMVTGAEVDRNRKNRKGIRIVDKETGMTVAHACNIGKYMPMPLGRPEFTGDIIISGLIRHQNSGRDSLSPEFLKSARWQDYIGKRLFALFQGPLREMLGEQGEIKNNAVGNAMRDVCAGAVKVWGNSTLATNTNDDVGPGSVENPNPGLSGTTNKQKGKKKNRGSAKTERKTRAFKFPYRGIEYLLAITDDVPDIDAQLLDDTTVYLNNANPVLRNMRASGPAMRLYVFGAVVRAIERQNINHYGDIEACDRAVSKALNLWYSS